MNSLRLLIVDDEPLIRDGIRRALMGMDGLEVAGECDSGSRAIEAILSHPPDLVLLDVQMPDCTGLEVIRKIGPQNMPPVVFITAYDEYAVTAFELNAVDYLLKPFDDDRLYAAVGRARRTCKIAHSPLRPRRHERLSTRAPAAPQGKSPRSRRLRSGRAVRARVQSRGAGARPARPERESP